MMSNDVPLLVSSGPHSVSTRTQDRRRLGVLRVNISLLLALLCRACMCLQGFVYDVLRVTCFRMVLVSFNALYYVD